MSYLLIGLEGTTLTARERDWLAWPQIGGVVLFGRNFAGPEQLHELLRQIHAINPGALTCVDQEGGLVQRFGAPCTRLPPLGAIGRVYDRDRRRALELAFCHGALMAAEVLALGVDLSLAPVMDLDGGSRVIGVRAFHRRPTAVAELAARYVGGMAEAGMAACGKHFPGHGSVLEDTHLDVAIDGRGWEAISARDLLPFARACAQDLAAIMMAHVRYPRVCKHAAGYSKIWIQDILRGRLGFTGVVISDDLGMRAAAEAGPFGKRVAESLAAGCDLLLICRPEDVREALTAPSALPREAANGAPPGAALRAGRPDLGCGPAAPEKLAAWRRALSELTVNQ